MPTSPAVPWARLSLKAVLVPRTGAAGSQGVEFLAMEREYLAGEWTTARVLLGLLVPGSLAALAVVFWKRSIVYGLVLITLVSHAAQGTITIGRLWSAGPDFAQANLLFGVVASAVSIGLVIFDRKAWRGPAPAPATTVPSVPAREATPAAPA